MPERTFDQMSEAEQRATRERERLRAAHEVRPITGAEEGTALARLPAGVYGFSYAPLTAAPVYNKRDYQSFELHRLAGGERLLIGFVREADAARLQTSAGARDVPVYPDIWNEAANIVVVPIDRVANSKGPERDNGNPVLLTLHAKN